MAVKLSITDSANTKNNLQEWHTTLSPALNKIMDLYGPEAIENKNGVALVNEREVQLKYNGADVTIQIKFGK